MLTKLMSRPYNKKIACGLAADMVKEILGCLDMIGSDIDHDEMNLLVAHERLFVSTIENELQLIDKITMYTYARWFCMDILDNRKHTLAIRYVVHSWTSQMERRLTILHKTYERTGSHALRNAYERIVKYEYASKHPRNFIIDRAILLIMKMDKKERNN